MDLIVAADLGCAIGRKNGLIYSLPEDMKYFRRMTAGKTAEMRSKKALADSNDEIRAIAMEAVQKLLINDGNALDKFLDAAESEQRDE